MLTAWASRPGDVIMLRAHRSDPALHMLITPLRRCIMNGCGSFNDGLQAHALASASVSQGTDTSEFSARLLYSLIVPAGSAHGMFALAQMMRLGICGVQRDVAAAAQQYAAAAQLQHAAACSNLGAMHEHGLGVSQNLQEALRLYDLAASLGNSVAHDNSAVLQRKMQDPQSTFPVAAPASVESAPVPVAADSKYAPTEDEALLLRSITRVKHFISCTLLSNVTACPGVLPSAMKTRCWLTCAARCAARWMCTTSTP
jgi:TPR repeat protein